MKTKEPEAAPARRLLHTAKEAQDLLNIGVTKFYEVVSDGRLAAVRDGRNIKIPDDALRAYVQALKPWKSRGAP